jgi:hypothetical protein
MSQSPNPPQLHHHPLVKRTMTEAIDREGCNSAASEETQEALKAWLCKKTGKKHCFLYSSSRLAVLDLIQNLSLMHEITITNLVSLESFQQWAVNFGRMKIRIFRDLQHLTRILDDHDPERVSEYVCMLNAYAVGLDVLQLATSRVKTVIDASVLTQALSLGRSIVLNFASPSLAGIGSVCFNEDLALLECMTKRHIDGAIRSHEVAAALACASLMDGEA